MNQLMVYWDKSVYQNMLVHGYKQDTTSTSSYRCEVDDQRPKCIMTVKGWNEIMKENSVELKLS